MKLIECITVNYHILGPQCENLGKKPGSFGFGYRKIMLASTGKDQWELVEFNILQLFLRNVFGAYKSTHLDTITKELNKIECKDMTDEINVCQLRIQDLWMKKNMIALGNADISEAKVIGFAEKHGDKSFRASIAQLINAEYREGDVVLVEGLKAGEQIESTNHQLTKKIKMGCIVRGWEPENFEELNGSSFSKSTEMYQELIKCYFDFKKDFRVEGIFTEEELSLAKVKLDVVIGKIKLLNEYYRSKSKLILETKVLLEGWFEKLKNGTLSKEGKDGYVFIALVNKVVCELEIEQEKAIYKNMTSNQENEYIKVIDLRNASLVNEISKYRKEGRRVFVIAGASHLVNDLGFRKDCEIVQEELRKSQFTLFTRKSDFNFCTARFNPNIQVRNFISAIEPRQYA